MKSGGLSTVVFLLKICVDTPVQCSFNMKNQQVRKHTVKSTYFYSSNFGKNANAFLQYDFVKMLLFGAFLKFFLFFREIMQKFAKPQWTGEITFFSEKSKTEFPNSVWWSNTKKQQLFVQKTTNFMFLSVILYGIFAVFTFFHFISKSCKKSVVPRNIAWKENLNNCTFFTIFEDFHDL